MHSAATTPIHVVDFEGNQRCGIIEFGVATLQGSAIVQTKTRLCRATAAICEWDTRQHGIRKVDTDDCAPFADEWAYFVGLRQSGPLCAHHATVEQRLLKGVWAYPPQSTDFLNVEQLTPDWGPWIDTCRLFQCVFPDLRSHKLSALIEDFDLHRALQAQAEKHCPNNRRRFHCALYDAIASALLLRHLLTLPGYETATVAWLIHNSAASKVVREKQQQKRLF